MLCMAKQFDLRYCNFLLNFWALKRIHEKILVHSSGDTADQSKYKERIKKALY